MNATRRGFTLIELAVVLLIIALLCSMLMPMLGTIQRHSMRSRAGFILKKLDTCLRLFKDEFGVYPYQAQYPEPLVANTYPNRLAYQIGKDISDGDRANVMADMKSAASAFNYGATFAYSGENESATQPAPGVVYRKAYMVNAGAPVQSAYLANRMASEQNRLAVLAGDVAMRGPYIYNTVTKVMVQDLRPITVIPAPVSAVNPGWAINYLNGEIEKRYIDGDAVRDPWGSRVIYICQAIPGVRPTPINLTGGVYAGKLNAKGFGLGALGFDTTSGPASTLIPSRPLLLYGGRVRLSRVDAGDGQPTPADATYLPDPSNLMRSDVRYYSAPGYETEFELWSAGPDRAFSYMRDGSGNADNVSVLPYNRLLKND